MMTFTLTILDRYIGRSFLEGFLMVIIVLVSFFTFLDFVEALRDVGTGAYGTPDALLTVLLTTPGRMLPLAPTAALIGCLFALGKLRHNSEIIAMTAAGVSGTRFACSAMKTGALLILAIATALQFVVPPLEQLAWQHRMMAISGTLGLHSEKAKGVWFRDQSRFIHVQEMNYGKVPTDLEIFEFNVHGELSTFTRAREADLREDGMWTLHHVTQSVITDGHITTQRHSALPWDSFLVPQQLAILTINPEALSLSALFHYARDLQHRGENADRYVLVLWQKLSIPLATAGMVLISIPFLFGSNRATTAGKKMMIGVVVGIAFYLGNKIFAYIGILLEWNPVITALAPVIALIVAAIWLLRRIDER